MSEFHQAVVRRKGRWKGKSCRIWRQRNKLKKSIKKERSKILITRKEHRLGKLG